MALKSINPTTTKAWDRLQNHFNQIKTNQMMDWFELDKDRANKFTIKWDDFYVDFSKNRITDETLTLFGDLAEEIDLKDAISKYFSGDKINETENRSVLHTALRSTESEISINGINVVQEIQEVKSKIKSFTNLVV